MSVRATLACWQDLQRIYPAEYDVLVSAPMETRTDRGPCSVVLYSLVRRFEVVARVARWFHPDGSTDAREVTLT